MSPRTTYVVTGGCGFGGSGIVAVFNEKSVADRYVEVTRAGVHFGPLRVIEVPQNPFLEPLLGGLRPFEVHADDADMLAVRIVGEPTEHTIWAAEPDSARMIARLRPKGEAR